VGPRTVTQSEPAVGVIERQTKHTRPTVASWTSGTSVLCTAVSLGLTVRIQKSSSCLLCYQVWVYSLSLSLSPEEKNIHWGEYVNLPRWSDAGWTNYVLIGKSCTTPWKLMGGWRYSSPRS
jgi:hypothetical protein